MRLADWVRSAGAQVGRPDVMLDLHIYGGLLVAGWGGWHISKEWTCVSLGLALMAIGLWGSRRRTG